MIKLPKNFKNSIVDVTETFKHYFVDEFAHVTKCYFDHSNGKIITIHPNINDETLISVEHIQFKFECIENVHDLLHEYEKCKRLSITTNTYSSYEKALAAVMD